MNYCRVLPVHKHNEFKKPKTATIHMVRITIDLSFVF